jgi:hypothetical protein
LLEVLLSLMLASLVLLAVAMAVDFQLRVVERSRGDVEEAQLARVLLQRIARDLRGAVAKDPLNMADLVEEAAAAESALSGDSGGEGGESAAGSDQGSSSFEGSEDSEGEEDDESDTLGTDEDEEDDQDEAEDPSLDEDETAESTPPQSTPGLYGDADWIQVDVGILPRLDQYDVDYTATEDSAVIDRLSDVKTVTYYVVESDDETGYAADGTPTGGLVRREQDRAVGLWNSDAGSLDEDPDVTPIAPEVTEIAFQYWDGTEWAESWDTEESEGLPAAVQITLTLRAVRDPNATVSSAQDAAGDTTEEQERFTYSLTVPLLAAGTSTAGEAAQETDESSGTGESGEMSETSESGSADTADREEASR